VAEQPRDDDDLRAVRLGEPRLERFADHVRGEVLVLDVDVVAGFRDHLEVERLDVVHALVAVRGRHGAGHREARFGERHGQLFGPGVRRDLHGLQRLAGRGVPALACDFREHPRGLAVHGDHDVMKGGIGLTFEDAFRVLRLVLARVPALVGEVEAARERELVVDDDDLLVVRPRHRMRVVEAEVDAPVRLPLADAERGRDLAIGSEHDRVIPVEDADPQVALAPREAVQEIAQLDRLPGVVVAQPRAAVEIPGEDQDRALGALGGAHERLEVFLGVDDERDAVRPSHGQAILAGLEES
jgi:hypothetical protein